MDFGAYDGLIFDLDGTLIDSAYIWEEIDRIFFSKRGLPVPEDYAERGDNGSVRCGCLYQKACRA